MRNKNEKSLLFTAAGSDSANSVDGTKGEDLYARQWSSEHPDKQYISGPERLRLGMYGRRTSEI